MPAPTDPAAAVDEALSRHDHQRTALVQILRDVQSRTRWLPREVLRRIADGVGLTPAIVEGVAGFYRFFHLQPVGRVHLLFSDNVTDRMLGSRALAADLCARLGIEPGQVAADGSVSVGFTSCTGLGDQGPALLVDQHQVLTRMDAARVAELARLVRAGVPPTNWPADWQRVDPGIRRAGVLLGAAPLAGPALRALLVRGADAMLAELAASGLRGRGGAGFDTARKWSLCRAAAVPEGGTRVVVCNADEGEPGTFKDRVLLTEQADTVFEGMTVAARVLGARQGFVYLRGEYRFMLPALQAVLARRRAAGLLGGSILGTPGFDFDIAIHLGAGAYVCGEESALIESLEGKRGQPRIRPPFPVESGYLGQPTVVNNVETFAAAARIAERGGAWWAAIGVPGSTGTKLHSVSGDVARPGIYELPFGVTVGEILAEAGAAHTQAVQVGGPSGLCLAAHEFGRRIAFDDVPTAGAFMVFDATRDMFEVAHGFAQFFAHESCGFCTPCRVGTELVRRRFDKLAQGHGSMFDEAELRALESLLHGTTHCGLGATATNPLRDTLARFRPAYERRLASPRFVPGFDLDAELAPARRVTGRDDAGAHLEQKG
ncbi:MAG: NAD(P)H-dependent oxidoreductase subunit E [Burkholderiaceae bacterium]|jgi:[NiFe] hydrogenase diaphorase moiety large subunit|nr:NAD(P)H-dependent oxidoreductase subunit E [Burkholderiaceae bacterium]MCP5290190.1 NAD(P)H-dependent oxidoreductase subunit E [Burkholderiaceae bacterium]